MLQTYPTYSSILSAYTCTCIHCYWYGAAFVLDGQHNNLLNYLSVEFLFFCKTHQLSIKLDAYSEIAEFHIELWPKKMSNMLILGRKYAMQCAIQYAIQHTIQHTIQHAIQYAIQYADDYVNSVLRYTFI